MDEVEAYISTEWPSFLPHLIVGLSENEWELFCRFYDTIPHLVQGDIKQIIAVADDILNSVQKEMDDRIVASFYRFIQSHHMTLLEGLIHPYMWIRRLTHCYLLQRK